MGDWVDHLMREAILPGSEFGPLDLPGYDRVGFFQLVFGDLLFMLFDLCLVVVFDLSQDDIFCLSDVHLFLEILFLRLQGLQIFIFLTIYGLSLTNGL